MDGELYVHGWPLQRINAAVTPVRQKPTEDTPLVEYHVFDRVDYGLPFYERIKLAFDKLDNVPGVIRVTTSDCPDEAFANRFYAMMVEAGMEGIMYRLDDCPYTLPKQPAVKTQSSRLKFLSDQDNRVWHLLKRKDWQDAEFECKGIQEGEGKYQGTLGAFEYICDGGYFSAGSGLTDAQRQKYWDHPELAVGKLHKIKYLCLSSDGIPLNPTILAIL